MPATPGSLRSRRLSVVLVGQRPPPYGGQTLMTALTLDMKFSNAQLHHVPTAFSRSMQEMRSLQLRKVVHLLATIARITAARVRHRADVLYFTPSPPESLPVVRDVVLLLATRWMFPRTVFHFHAAGVSSLLDRRSGPWGALLWWAYRHPDVAIRLSELTPQDGRATGARREVIVPNAIPARAAGEASRSGPPIVLFVGLLSAEKGLFRLLEMASLLKQGGAVFRLHLVGEFDSEVTRRTAEAFLAEHGLRELVVVAGVLVGEAKTAAYDGATVFCFLSAFPAETCPLVVLEAMQAGLPVVASRWSGIPGMVAEGESAELVDADDIEAAAAAVRRILEHDAVRASMAQASRRHFDAHFTTERYRSALDDVFAGLIALV